MSTVGSPIESHPINIYVNFLCMLSSAGLDCIELEAYDTSAIEDEKG